MTRVKQGEQSALEQLFARWEGALFAFFYRLGCPPGSVEDLTEEVLVTLYRQRERYDVARPFAPWLYGVARIVWQDHRRHRGRELARTAPLDAAAHLPTGEPDPSRHAEVREEADATRRAIGQLPDEQRAAFILRHYQGLAYHEIGEVLQVPLGTVKWRIHDAVRRVEASLMRSRREGA